ncbi:transglycosylase SLT domain-containing protein [Acinetobacter sp. IK40]|uniref:transglycosylase SLT domain-containing protein n=1 Tax=Acinetobacter sp. IK40 TaxID=2928897 RepID=UPI002D1F7880|nr:transglycosylase SLT domain-containing protein [Acinetobacter sp. IK40]MEB3790141.1 transglycosylase SLT domain-containing protein [Acinetobacter sp. IK40]
MDILTDDELSLNQDDPRYKPKSQRGTIADLGLGVVSGVAMGTVEVATSPDALVRGNKKASALRAQNLSIFKPDDLGAAGEFTYGLTRDFTKVGWNALTSIGSGGLAGIGAQAGLFGFQSYEAEKADLINMGADESTAARGAAIRGVTDAATFAIPVHGVAKNVVADAVSTTGLAIGGGMVGDYVEGDYLKDSGIKKVAQYGEGLKENVTSPSTIAANGGMALLLNLWANKGKLRPEQAKQIEQTDAATDAAHIQANIEHAEKSNIFEPETAKDANSHFDALDASTEQALNNEIISLRSPVTGRPKSIVASPKRMTAQAQAKTIQPVSIGPSEFSSIKYNDPRLDTIADNKGIEMEMQWATPLIKAIRKSGEKSNNNQVSPKGAKSVMQFIPSTFNGLKKKYGKNWDINNPSDMTEAAYYLIRDISKEYKTKDPRVIAAHYNGGYKNGRSVQNTGKAVHAETIGYIDRISKSLDSSSATPIIRSSNSEFPEFESVDSKPVEYRSQGDAEVLALPNIMRDSLVDDIDLKNDLENNFKDLEAPLTKEDLDYLRDTAHYQPYDGNTNRVPYVEPQITLSGKGVSMETRLAQLEQSIEQVQTTSDPQQSTVGTSRQETFNNQSNVDDQIDGLIVASDAPSANIDNWQGTRSESYLKRSMAQSNGSTLQQLYSKNLNTTFERQINSDGTISPVKAIKNGQDLFNSSKGNDALSKSQNNAAQALDREFWQPKSNREEGAPDLTKNSNEEYGAFSSTADGREALEIMESNPDMQISYTRLDHDGNEEFVTASARDLLDDLRAQEEIAKEDIAAVKALASCALQFG